MGISYSCFKFHLHCKEQNSALPLIEDLELFKLIFDINLPNSQIQKTEDLNKIINTILVYSA